jgi:hypothetical protein
MAEICAETAAYLLEGSIDRTLLFGPVVWLPSDGTSARQWCFIVVGCDRIGETRHDQLNAETESDTLAFRAGVMAALIELRSSVMHDFDDELAMARMAEAAWPRALRDHRFERHHERNIRCDCLRVVARSALRDGPVGHLGLFGLAPAAFTGKVVTNATAWSSHALSASFVGTGGSI